MKLLNWFKKADKQEQRSYTGAGYTADIMAARSNWINGTTGVAELTATVQGAVSLWEQALSLADVDGADMLDRRTMALLGRSLALRGEFVAYISEDGLVPASDWVISTRNGKPRAYSLTLPDTSGGHEVTALAGEVLHVVIGADLAQPYFGSSPLRRASLTGDLLATLESALGEAYAAMPLGSQIVPFPEAGDADMDTLARGFRGKRGRVLLRESVAVTAAGGPAPSQDWKASDVSPDMQKSMSLETLESAKHSISNAFGVLPGMVTKDAQGPMVREGQRHLAQWTLQPICALVAEEASAKFGSPVRIDVMRPMQAFDAGGRARAAAGIIEALALAKEAGVDADKAMHLVDWADG
ncbi:phage portal protein [Pontibaca salina]|uniref:Phage portal protein n=1 Tax=Pontibaca salina TaxID=2795731 RepID=A0A934M040_9RHOB|nr:phage portal protein [Pontibaca salina]MBI6628271.1 phage portal protein [Pontibaca salina]